MKHLPDSQALRANAHSDSQPALAAIPPAGIPTLPQPPAQVFASLRRVTQHLEIDNNVELATECRLAEAYLVQMTAARQPIPGGADQMGQILAALAGLQNNFAAMQDRLTEAQDRLGASIAGVEERLSASIAGVEERLGARITQVEERLGARITQVEERLGARITQVEERLGARITQVDQRLAQVEARLGQRIDAMGADLAAVQGTVGRLDRRLLVQEVRSTNKRASASGKPLDPIPSLDPDTDGVHPPMVAHRHRSISNSQQARDMDGPTLSVWLEWLGVPGPIPHEVEARREKLWRYYSGQ